MSVTISIILDKRRMKKKTGTYPLKLQVIADSEPFRYQTKFDLSVEDYKKLSASRISEELQKVRDTLKLIQRNAEIYLEQNNPFNIHEFEKDFIKENPLFLQRKRKAKSETISSDNKAFDLSIYLKKFPILKENHSSEDCISVAYRAYVIKLLEEERIGSAINYQDSYNSLKKFGGNVKFNAITTSYLIRYEKWMLNRGCSKSTIGIKLRPLRAVFNYAIDSLGIIKRDKCYPFGRYKYQIPTSRNRKKSLEMDVVGKLYYYDVNCEEERKARDFWFFCYFGNGMNPKDIAFLKYKNIDGEYLIFERAKTERTTRTNPKPITVFITEEMWKIIEAWGNKEQNPNSYIFPILQPGMTALDQHFTVKAFGKFINHWVGKIKTDLGIDIKIGTLEARHTFSTRMKRSGASTEYIQEALGHMDKKTTENYLNSFEKEVKKEFAAKLSPFKLKSVSKTA